MTTVTVTVIAMGVAAGALGVGCMVAYGVDVYLQRAKRWRAARPSFSGGTSAHRLRKRREPHLAVGSDVERARTDPADPPAVVLGPAPVQPEVDTTAS
jgi:hypothetical protein